MRFVLHVGRTQVKLGGPVDTSGSDMGHDEHAGASDTQGVMLVREDEEVGWRARVTLGGWDETSLRPTMPTREAVDVDEPAMTAHLPARPTPPRRAACSNPRTPDRVHRYLNWSALSANRRVSGAPGD